MDPITGNIITAIIAAGAAIVVGLINNHASIKKMSEEQAKTIERFMSETDKQRALTDMKIQTLTEEVKKHNSLIERTYALEAHDQVIDEKIAELEKKAHHE